ncbi:C-type natriuretic peptide 3 [Oryzias melastigma]|uniref:C-type natriuretic peptide 3 n=1 Tax=Oryzias melastigma TaxID=30732 RepID=A0A3B3DY21_ORYME|nr:natriuretic peptide A-like [Oryzias melastigma]KAF6723620.1 C-type natriuretic peptide 3 [Oryzias melastigma]
MSLRAFLLCVCLLLQSVGARTASELQSLERLLQDQLSSTEQREEERRDRTHEDPQLGASTTRDAADENALTRLLADLMRTSKRSWGRYKKGGMRSCFGVRLERIGSFSGLGC